MIEFKNISKKYRGQPKNAVDAFTLRIESGQYLRIARAVGLRQDDHVAYGKPDGGH